MWLLTIEDDEGLTTFHRLSGERYTLGRATGNDFVLAQLDVSRRHALLERRGEGFVYIDQNSTTGSFVDGFPIDAHKAEPLLDGAVVQLSGYVLRFKEALENLPTPPPRYIEPARLRGMSGLAAGVDHVFERDAFVIIGSDDECTVRVPHARVSDRHAVIRTRPDGRHELLDKSRSHLLFVNGQQLNWSAQLLEDGDAISVGGVALFRYLAASRQPEPRLNEGWRAGDGESPAPLPHPWALEARALRPAEDTLPDDRVETAGPLPPPEARAPSASFERLLQTTIGSSRGPVVVERGSVQGGAPQSDQTPVWYPRSPSLVDIAGEGALPLSEGAAAGALAERSLAGQTLAALTTPAVGLRGWAGQGPLSPPEVDAWPDEAKTPEASPAPLSAGTKHRYAAFVKATAWAAALAVCLYGAWRLPLSSNARGVERAQPLAVAATPPVPSAGVVAPLALVAPVALTASAPALPAPSPTTLTAPAPAPPAPSLVAPSAPAPPPTGGRSTGTSRSALEARVRSGRASANEVHALLSLCQQAGDASCVAIAYAALNREPAP
jgi:pSer/pThr/pTyr-binding forkhead associated (FHA) protein